MKELNKAQTGLAYGVLAALAIVAAIAAYAILGSTNVTKVDAAPCAGKTFPSASGFAACVKTEAPGLDSIRCVSVKPADLTATGRKQTAGKQVYVCQIKANGKTIVEGFALAHPNIKTLVMDLGQVG